eukprot:TRINITY_DN7307_c1_g1_i1.p1 TRINITY_DN7307_c1_g1~~TRINITY_DN7307_c1_g1_i1.p1  ORF type:complete len:537 (-),score=115.32 TRINITY_DN7307_c1_g1_i1:466-2076(-)
MSHTTTNDSDDGMPRDHINSPSIDEGSSGGSGGTGVLKKGPWTSTEDAILVDYVKKHGEGNWNAVQKHSGLLRCGKSCRLRWANHLRPNLKKGAFTPEEERLIIELHAKMGNKWARMAAHLPGRTDNEIKNYWNTRIKRLQRAGLPLYPPDICLQALNEGQQNQNVSELSGSDAQNNDLLQRNNYDIPDVVFDNYKAPQGPLSYAAAFPDISGTGIMTQALGSSHNYIIMPPTVHQTKRPRESDALFPGFLGRVSNGLSSFDPLQIGPFKKICRPFGLELPYDPYPNSKNPAPFSGPSTGSHAPLNGNISTSKPLSKAVKLELPSLQYHETDTNYWATCPPAPLETMDAYLQSPPAMQVQSDSDCPPWNSGLLEEVIHGPRVKNQSSEKSLNSSVTPADAMDKSTLELHETEWGDYGDPISPLGCSASSVFSECTPISVSSLDETAPVKVFHGGGKEDSTQLDKHVKFLRPDALLGSDCLEQDSDYAKDLAALLSEDFCNDYKYAASGTSTFSQGWVLGSCPWNNMPAVCQMSEHP